MRRTPLLLVASTVASASLLLAGCGATSTPVAPAAATQDAAAEAVPLADGLLPADRFAPGGTVTRVTPDDVAAALGGAHGQHGVDPGQVSITPAACTDALEVARTALGDPSDVDDAVGQYTRSGFGGTAEVLAVGGPSADLVGTLTTAVAASPTATVDTALGQAVVEFGAVTQPALGDAAAVVPVSVTLTPAQGAAMSGSGLVGVVADGDRVLALATAGLGTTPDPVAFTALLTAAQDHAVDVLG
ncbi:hypothetical protein TEK04_07165 [Klenkia sp. LSe6-5]|uniref:DUF5642 domain-containing protein n=1 Tax=Klenkia sesuvii TaxID=3103137 RepID=A0ABU8DRM1_9ACTN